MGYTLACLALLVLGVAVHADEPEKVVGGRFARPGEFPFQVSLQAEGFHFCGGSLISTRHVLTAAHCVDGQTKPYYSYVVTGTHNLDRGGEIHRIKNIKVHENYMGDRQYSWKNDIALITLEDDIKMSQTQRPIRLGRSYVPGNEKIEVSGFGYVKANGPASRELKTAELYVIDQNACRQFYYGMPIHDSQICIYLQTGTGVCSGDSGGPMIHNGEVIGVASWVSPCAVGAPDVYTRVSEFIPWIEQAQRESYY